MTKYIMKKVECPVCDGEGVLHTMTWLTYDGDQTWHTETCPRCSGDRFSYEPIKCPFCGDPILETESADNEGVVCHATCLMEEMSNANL